MLLLIDNYDSFTWNLWHALGTLGHVAALRRNDALSAEEAMALKPAAIILSPGPCDPDRAGVCLDLIGLAAKAGTPVLGVCLGHQAIGQAFGATVRRCDEVMHGKVSNIRHRGEGVFAGLPDPVAMTRYHSLDVAREGLPDCLAITAETESGVVMGLRHRELPIHGVQFHPESIAAPHGPALMKTFLQLAGLS